MFGLTPEYALSASILAIDLSRLPSRLPYDLPTLDDETRPGTTDPGDPLGRKDRNQAVVDPKGPVRLFATGFRNPYDIVLSHTGRIYTVDNSPAWYWGGPPTVDSGRCSNATQEHGRYVPDALYLVEEGLYGGHPNPTRSSTDVTFNASNPQSPVDRGDSRECTYSRATGPNVLTTFDASTNGIAEYTASNFGGLLRGDLIAASTRSADLPRPPRRNRAPCDQGRSTEEDRRLPPGCHSPTGRQRVLGNDLGDRLVDGKTSSCSSRKMSGRNRIGNDSRQAAPCGRRSPTSDSGVASTSLGADADTKCTTRLPTPGRMPHRFQKILTTSRQLPQAGESTTSAGCAASPSRRAIRSSSTTLRPTLSHRGPGCPVRGVRAASG